MKMRFSPSVGAASLLCLAFALLLLFLEPARGTETWIKWFFGNVFLETGEFMAHGRSTLYSLYTIIFAPLGYPVGPLVARLFDTAFIFSGLYVLFAPYAGPVLRIVLAAIWLPGLLELGAAVNGMSISALFWAYSMRRKCDDRARLAYSYAFLMLAAMFRPNFLILLPAAFIYDCWRICSKDGVSNLLRALKPRRCDAFFALLLGLFVVFSLNQSTHRWNNGWGTDLKWIGVEGSALALAAQIGTLAHIEIQNHRGGDYENNDVYFVVKEEFGDVKSIFDLLSRYDLYLEVLYNNKQIIRTLALHTDFGRYMTAGFERVASHKFSYPIFYTVLLIGLIGFYRSTGDPALRRHYLEIVGASVVMIAPILLIAPSSRYTMFFIPIFSAAGLWYGRQLAKGVATITGNPPLNPFAASVCILVPFILMSNVISKTANAIDQLNKRPFSLAERPYIVNQLYNGHALEMFAMLKSCKGIMMTNHSLFAAAFSGIPKERFYAIGEIPPFGKLGDGSYDGLRPERIDCLVIPGDSVGPGIKTYDTRRSRYLNYLLPYTAQLEAMGAHTTVFDARDGTAVTVLK